MWPFMAVKSREARRLCRAATGPRQHRSGNGERCSKKCKDRVQGLDNGRASIRSVPTRGPYNDDVGPSRKPRGHRMKIRDASADELAQPRKRRVLSPRQLAVIKREQTIEKLLNELGAGAASTIKKIELDEGEKLNTIRASVQRVIK